MHSLKKGLRFFTAAVFAVLASACGSSLDDDGSISISSAMRPTAPGDDAGGETACKALLGDLFADAVTTCGFKDAVPVANTVKACTDESGADISRSLACQICDPKAGIACDAEASTSNMSLPSAMVFVEAGQTITCPKGALFSANATVKVTRENSSFQAKADGSGKDAARSYYASVVEASGTLAVDISGCTVKDGSSRSFKLTCTPPSAKFARTSKLAELTCGPDLTPTTSLTSDAKGGGQ